MPDAPIPCLDLAPLHALLRAEIDAAFARVLDTGHFILGESLAAFETNAARYLGVRHAIGVANGTDALLLALKGAGIGAGDEVITSAFSFFATAEAIVLAGAQPVFADIEPASMTLDPEDVERRVTSRTRALLPVHLFGAVANMPALLDISTRHELIVIEDAAQAFGARRNDRRAGTFGIAGAFSFHPTKPLGALGDGGMIVTNDDDLARRLRLLRNHGAPSQHLHVHVATNSRLDDLQAAVLDVKLGRHDAHLRERTRLAARYRVLLEDSELQLPATMPGHAWAQYTLRHEHRDELRDALARHHIGSAVHYPRPLYRQPALAAHVDRAQSLPVTEAACARCLSIPLYEGLNEEQQQRVACVLRETC